MEIDGRLIIEQGMHAGPILAAGTDAAGRYLATSGADGVRLWDVADGAALGYLPEVGPAFALSPDGKQLAVACQKDVVLLRRDTGRVLGWIYAGVCVRRVVFSPSSTYLLLLADDGLQVRHAQSGALLWEREQEDLPAVADMDEAGRVVVSLKDGLLLLNPRGAPIAEVRARSVSDVRFSPDGRRVAVAHGGLSIHSGRDLSLVHQPARDEPLQVTRVAWSAAGQLLYAAGLGSERPQVLRIEDGGRGAVSAAELPSADNVIALHALPKGEVFFTTAEPAWGVLDVSLRPRLHKTRALARLGSEPGDLRVGKDARELRVVFTPERQVTRISLLDNHGAGRLETPLAPENDLPAAPVAAPWLKLLKGGERLRIVQEDERGERREEFSYERFAIGPDGQHCLVLKDGKLTCVRATVVKKDWEVHTDGESVTGLALAENNRHAITAGQDGALRLYGAGGRKLLTILLGADRQSWLAFTPAGYFSGAPDAESWAGWQVRKDAPYRDRSRQLMAELTTQSGEAQGWMMQLRARELQLQAVFGQDPEKRIEHEENQQQAKQRRELLEKNERRHGWRDGGEASLRPDFFPLALFGDTLRRPDIVRLDVSSPPAVDIAALLPPSLRVISPTSGEIVTGSEWTIYVALRVAPGRPLSALRAFVDTQLVQEVRGAQIHDSFTLLAQSEADEEVHALRVTLPGRDFQLGVQAESAGVRSTVATANLRYGGYHKVIPDRTQAWQDWPRLFVLSVGVSRYRSEPLRLRYADKDARDVVEVFRRQEGRLYRQVHPRLLVNEEVTQASLLDALEQLRGGATARDVTVVFLAGHGVNDPASERYYFLPHDADEEAIMRTMLPATEIRETLSRIPGKVVLFLDTCHAGNIFGKRFRNAHRANNVVPFVHELASADNGVVVFAAAGSQQYSQEDPSWQNGAFTKALVDGLSGAADTDRSGRVTVSMLETYIYERVRKLTGGKQTPTSAKPESVTSFPLALSQPLAGSRSYAGET